MTDAAPHNNFPFGCKPDCSVYDRCSNDKDVLNFALMDFFIEFKTWPHHDPFSIELPSLTNKSEGNGSNPLLNTTITARGVLGQIISYATLLLGSQCYARSCREKGISQWTYSYADSVLAYGNPLLYRYDTFPVSISIREEGCLLWNPLVSQLLTQPRSFRASDGGLAIQASWAVY